MSSTAAASSGRRDAAPDPAAPVPPHSRTALLRAADGVPIEAAYAPGPGPAAPAIVVAHGFTGALERPAIRRAAAVFAQRAGVVTFSFRGHGGSGGRSTVGDREVLDLAAAVAWARSLGHARVATVGFSMGGSVVLRHGALYRREARGDERERGGARGARGRTERPRRGRPGARPTGEPVRLPRARRRAARERTARWRSARARTARWRSAPTHSAAGAIPTGTVPYADAVVSVSSAGPLVLPRHGADAAAALDRGAPYGPRGLPPRPEDPHPPPPLEPGTPLPHRRGPLIAPTPLLIVHGTRDTYFPLDHPEALAEAAEPGAAELWLEEDFAHAENAASDELLERIAAWAAEAVSGRSS